MGEQALRWRHPTCVSLTIAMQTPCFVYVVHDHTRGCVVAGMLHRVTGQNYPTKGLPYSIIHRLVATLFS